MAENENIPEVTPADLEKLKAFNAGSSLAYSKVGLMAVQLDPTHESAEMNVLIKYLDAWLAEINLKNAGIKDYAEELQKESFNGFLQEIGVPCTAELAPAIQAEIKQRCSQVIAEVLNGFTCDNGDADIDPDDIDREDL